MLSRKFKVKLSHYRHSPKKHIFHYNVFFFGLDIDELPKLSKNIFFFSYNKLNIFSIHDKQYLEKGAESIKKKLYRYLDTKKVSKISRIELLTVPKFLGYVFNPISFYICYNDNQIECILAEVSNTYKERHLYILNKEDDTKLSKNGMTINLEKQFFVSPFNNVSGTYCFKVAIDKNSLDIGINLNGKNGKRIITTKMTGKSQPITNASVLKTLFIFPFSVFLTIPRITLQGILLKIKSLKTHLKPNPISALTIRKTSAPFHRKFDIYLLKINKYLKFIKR